MTARFRKWIGYLAETFWLIPAVLVLAGIALAFGAIWLDRSDLLPSWFLRAWLYDGGSTGARTLLGAVASSTIGVAGTVFSITIAALSLAAGQMGPRLLRNFTRDRGNQLTLGIFLATFSYSLVVLRSVRSQDEGVFVPHLALTLSILLALVCVATLVYFVGHMAGRINVDTVIELVGEEVQSAVKRLTTESRQPARPAEGLWEAGEPVVDDRRGYLQHLDHNGLADWAAKHGRAIRLLVGAGDYVYPGAPIAIAVPNGAGANLAIRRATALGAQRVSSEDLISAVRQLVEVAVRALSPGINDPHTAMSVLDRLGATLCDVSERFLPTGVFERDGRPALLVPALQYAGLVDAMFDMIRQNAAQNVSILIKLLEVLAAVASVERDRERLRYLEEHADRALRVAERHVAVECDLSCVRSQHATFRAACKPAEY